MKTFGLIIFIVFAILNLIGYIGGYLYVYYPEIKIKKIDKRILKLSVDYYNLSHDIKMHKYNKCINFKKTAPLIIERRNLKNRLKYVYTLKKYYKERVDEFYWNKSLYF